MSEIVTSVAAADTGDLGQNVAVEASRSIEEARGTIRELAIGISGLLPKIVIALILLALVTILTRLMRPVLRHAFGTWEKADAAAIHIPNGVLLMGLSAYQFADLRNRARTQSPATT